MEPLAGDGRNDYSMKLHREFQKGHAHYLAKALEQPLLLPKDMATLKNMRQPDFFLSLKRDLALVSSSACLADIMLGYLPFF